MRFLATQQIVTFVGAGFLMSIRRHWVSNFRQTVGFTSVPGAQTRPFWKIYLIYPIKSLSTLVINAKPQNSIKWVSDSITNPKGRNLCLL
jgi:hypothetical protein